MASPPITEASEIRRRGRQRLIGAIALVAILVVFVPMILDSEPRPPRPDSSLAIPSKVNAPPLPAPPPASASKAAPEHAKPTEPAPSEPVKAAPPAEAAKVAAVDPAKAVATKAPAADAKKAAPAEAPAPKLEGFAVQVGAFRDEAKLAQARQKLAGAGVAHYTERLDTPSGPLTRLRAGPFATREAAEAALATLKRAALDGKVVSLP